VKLKDKVAVVTGAGQGIGRAISLGLAREGASVVVADINGQGAQAVTTEIQKTKVPVLSCQTDVSRIDSVEKLKDQVLQRFDRIDIRVNNAGIYPACSITEMTLELWEQVIDTNLGGNFICTRAIIPHMRAAKAGRIIFSSTIGYKGAQNGSHAASKAGTLGFVKALARQVAEDGITVNAVCPGVTDTAQPRGHRSEEELFSMKNSIPLGRIGQPSDIVGPVVFSPAMQLVTSLSML
jgi:3-oxoacyl-[acyl-carrier protein] reductase